MDRIQNRLHNGLAQLLHASDSFVAVDERWGWLYPALSGYLQREQLTQYTVKNLGSRNLGLDNGQAGKKVDPHHKEQRTGHLTE